MVQGLFAAVMAFALVVHEGQLWPQIMPSQDPGEPGQERQSSFVSPIQMNVLPGNDSSYFRIPPEFSLAHKPLFDFKDTDVKFKVETLMNILRDRTHESWVLRAYPDPITGRPLIGAGFSLDVKATQHIQRNPQNPYQFIEPSSAELWQEAGFDLARLQNILDQFTRDLEMWTSKEFRKRIRDDELVPQLTEEEANRLLLVSVLQAIHNARAYCHDFDQLTGSQQMALTQLVFQMGVNLEQFVRFLSVINEDQNRLRLKQTSTDIHENSDRWRTAQRMLIESDWARRYTDRAVTVIAMLDPIYDMDVGGAQRRVRLQIRPLHHHHLRYLRAAMHHSASSLGRPQQTHFRADRHGSANDRVLAETRTMNAHRPKPRPHRLRTEALRRRRIAHKTNT